MDEADENRRRGFGSEPSARPEPRPPQEAAPQRWELLAARLPEDEALWFWVRAKLKFGPCAKRRNDRLLRLLFGAEFDESRARAQAWMRRG